MEPSHRALLIPIPETKLIYAVLVHKCVSYSVVSCAEPESLGRFQITSATFFRPELSCSQS